MYLAHKKENEIQSIKDHLFNVAKKAKDFGYEFNAQEMSYVCGLFHDVGKYSNKFQKRILYGGNKVDHSTAGAQLICSKYGDILGKMMGYCIAGHHGGLPNGGTKADLSQSSTLNGRLKKDIEDYSEYIKDIEVFPKCIPPQLIPLNNNGFTYAMLIKMIHSCLVDADFIDTKEFMSGNNEYTFNNLNQLDDKFNAFINNFESRSSSINIKRTDILNECIEKSQLSKGMFTFTVPTGGGKTISSMAFALKHAKKHNMNRIIYVIPYTSIIEQNAKVFKDIFGNQNVLEHHSNFNFDDNEDNLNNIIKLSSENWDIPIVVTTNVQFFESLFSNKPSKCRKLHNIANSVIVLDEAQMLPINFFKPCLDVLCELVTNYKSSVVLCSATQPNIKRYLPSQIKTIEICSNNEELYDFFKRTKIKNIGEIDDTDLINMLYKELSVLCIVNTRKKANVLYNKLIENDNSTDIYHLSTLMCPIHRKQTISKIKLLLKNNESCKVISTQLIEAGVDIDFPTVYRSMAGLDSIIQSAGRCNRENKIQTGIVHVFEEKSKNNLPQFIKLPIEITRSIFRNFDDVTSPAAISNYFEQLYNYRESFLDLYDISSDFKKGEYNLNFPFKDISQKFKLINNTTKSVIIPLDNTAQALINKLKFIDYYKDVLRNLQGYTVNIFEKEFELLLSSNKLEIIKDSIYILKSISDYDKKMGLIIPDELGEGIFP